MGEIAEDIIDGSCCALCGQYFVEFDKGQTKIKTGKNGVVNNATIFSHGYPVACKDCYDEDCGYQEAIKNTI